MSRKKSFIRSVLVMALWGCLFPLVKRGYSEYDIVTIADILCFAGVRFVICGLVISCISLAVDRQAFQNVRGAMVPILLSGLFSIVLHYSFTYSAMQMTDSSKTAILKQIGALLYVCFSFFLIKDDKPSVKKTIGAMFGFFGIVAINFGGGRVQFQVGDILIIGASLCTVFSNVISKKLFSKVKPLTATGISQLFGGIVLCIMGIMCGGNILFMANGNIGLLLLICLFSVISYSLWFISVKGGELSKLFIIKFLEPVFACVFSAFILHENVFKLQYIIAFLLISVGIIVSEKAERKDLGESQR